MKRALIVGAGIGGLAAGAALLQAGWSIRIFERAANPRELGFALNLAPNAMSALRELGVADEIRRAGYAARRVAFRGDNGRLLRIVDARDVVMEGVVAMRPVVHGALLNRVGADAVALAHDAIAWDATALGVTLRFRNGASAAGDILVGADGIASTIRRQLHPNEPPPQPSGYSAVRGAVHDIGDLLGDLDGVLCFAPGLEAAVVRAGSRSAYWYMSVRSHALAARGDSARLVSQHFAGRLDHTFRRVIDATDDADLRLDTLGQRTPLVRWGDGPVTLLGDAAHPMLPHTGQGAAQAIEDAIALKLALAREPRVERALRQYESIRAARTARVVALGPRIAGVTTTANPIVTALRNGAIRFAPTSLIVKALQNMDRRDPHAALRHPYERPRV